MLYVAGYTTSLNFDVVNAAQSKYAGDTTSIGFATYRVGTGNDEITGVAHRSEHEGRVRYRTYHFN
jgi:hypothetical protein